MDLHAEEYAAAVAYERRELAAFPRLTEVQRGLLRARARSMLSWLREHRALHDTIGVTLLLALLGGDLALLGLAPRLMSAAAPGEQSWLARVACGVVVGFLHGWLVCSIVTYTVHEGAAHDRIILGRGRLASLLKLLANNTPRLFFAVPDHYAGAHGAHHRGLGTTGDTSFTHHVFRRRLLLALLPLAPVFSWSDFFPWRPVEHTRSRRITTVASNAAMIVSAAVAYRGGGALYTALSVFVVGAWVSFALDRVRESIEHAYLPLDAANGTRELGLGFFGLLLGGGPWGQPCHLTHHLEPALPWYQQIVLHFHLVALLDARQRRAFLLRPVVGAPALLARVLAT